MCCDYGICLKIDSRWKIGKQGLILPASDEKTWRGKW